MIGIKLEGESEFLDTVQDTSIEITLENPLLGDETRLSPGSFSLPFTLPAGDSSPKNSELLKNPDVIENNEAYQIQKADLFFDGVPFKSGNLKAKSADGDRITAHFTFGLGSLAPDMKETKLREIMDEEVVISDDPISKEIYIKKVDEVTEASIDINGQVFTDDTTSGLSVLIQTYFTDNMVVDGDVWLPWSNLILVGGGTPKGLTTPYIQLRMARQVTNPITELVELEFSEDPHIPMYVKVDEDNANQFMIEGFDMTDYYADFDAFADARVKFPVMFNADLHEPEIGKRLEVINAVDTNGLVRNDPNFGFSGFGNFRVRNFNSLQPFVLLKHVLDKIADEFGFEYEGDFYEEVDLPTMLIDNSETLDLPMDYIGDRKFIFWRRSFNLNELVPDLSVVNFLKALASRYNIGVYYNESSRKVRLKKREAIAVSKDNEDITSMCSPIRPNDDLRYTGYKLLQNKDESDEFSVDEFLISGTPEKTYDINCGRLHRTQSAIVAAGLVTGPYTSRRNGVKFGFRIFHYKGLIDNGTYEYPAAGISGTAINETLTDFGNNLHLRFWRYWLRFDLNRRLVKVSVNYPFRLIRNYDFELKRRFDRSDFIVKSLRIRLTNQRCEVSEVELLTMR